MKTIGLIGGMSWESSAHYYRLINQGVRDRLGSPHSARLLLSSLDFAGIAALQHEGRWDRLEAMMTSEARRLEAAGAGAILLCTNTMHRMADAIAAGIGVPFLHIADPAGAALRRDGHRRAGLLGTAFTMEQPFFRERRKRHFGLEIEVPEAEERAEVHRIIYEELVNGQIEPGSRAIYRRIMAGLAERGAEAIIFGCTEIMLLVGRADSPVPVYDTTALHAAAAVDWMLG